MPEVNRMSNQVIRTLGGRRRIRKTTGQFTVNGELLQEIAAITGGEAFRSYDENKFREHFQSLEKTVYKRTVSNFPEERFAGLVWLALILLLGEILLRLTVLRKFP
jgi:Ca-activated chloride channel family protein